MDNKSKQQEALSLHENGLSPHQISEELGVSVRSVYRYMKQNIQPTENERSIPEKQKQEQTGNKQVVNNQIDNTLISLFKKGESTKYKCLGAIAEYASLTLTDKYQLTTAKRLLDNAIKRLQRREVEFHIIPEFLAASKDAHNMLHHFYTEAESLWHHLEQAIESIAEANYTQENKTRIKFQIRYELSKALCLPNATHTAREVANARAETFWCVANIIENNKGEANAFVDTSENIGYIQQDVEQHILDKLGIASVDIPY